MEFKEKVLKVVRRIPRGEFLTYKEVARLSGKPRTWRAVGNILNKNRNPEIPCHRVIRSNGEIGSYARGERKKTALLKKEGVKIRKKRVFNL